MRKLILGLVMFFFSSVSFAEQRITEPSKMDGITWWEVSYHERRLLIYGMVALSKGLVEHPEYIGAEDLQGALPIAERFYDVDKMVADMNGFCSRRARPRIDVCGNGALWGARARPGPT